MANTLRGEASFEHEGETLTLVFTTGTFLEIEDATGIGLFDLDEGMRKFGFLATLLQAGLAASGTKLAREEAAELILRNESAGGALRQALNRALPSSKGAETDPPKAAGKGGTGRKS